MRKEFPPIRRSPAIDQALRTPACTVTDVYVFALSRHQASMSTGCYCLVQLPPQLARVPPLKQIPLRTARRHTFPVSVSQPSEAPTFIVPCPSLGRDAQQAAPLLLVRVVRLLFRVVVLLRRTQCFAEHVCVKPSNGYQDFPNLLGAADLL